MTTPRVVSPEYPAAESFSDAATAVARMDEIYATSTEFLCERFRHVLSAGQGDARYRAVYPEVRISTTSYAQVDSRLSFGHLSEPGTYATTITRPDLFRHYLEEQIRILIENHEVPVTVGPSQTPIPVHFAVSRDPNLTVPQEGASDFTLRDVFDVPDLSTTNDDIVNGLDVQDTDGTGPLSLFSAQRVDYSLARLSHYTATDPEHFQNFVLFTNYQFYVAEFEAYARAQLADPDSGYTSFVSPEIPN